MKLNDIEILKQGKATKIGGTSALFYIIIEVDGEEYAVHLQTVFRIISSGNIIYTYNDLFEKKSKLKKRDAKLQAKLNLPLKVLDLKISEFNDLHIFLENNIELSTFTSLKSKKYEIWRIFKRKTDYNIPHLVAFCDRIEED